MRSFLQIHRSAPSIIEKTRARSRQLFLHSGYSWYGLVYIPVVDTVPLTELSPSVAKGCGNAWRGFGVPVSELNRRSI